MPAATSSLACGDTRPALSLRSDRAGFRDDVAPSAKGFSRALRVLARQR